MSKEYKFKGSTGEYVRLASSGDANSVDVEVIALIPGTFINAYDGQPVEITAKDVNMLHDKYNARVADRRKTLSKRLKNAVGRKEDVLEAPVQKDHILTQDMMVGRVVNEMWLAEEEGALQLRAKIRVMTKKFVEMTNLGLFDKVSIAYDPEDHYINEISFVPYGAVEGAERVFEKAKRKIAAPTKLEKLVKEQQLILKKMREVRVKIHAKKITTKLKKDGKLIPVYANRLEADLLCFSSVDDRRIALRMLSSLLDKDVRFKTLSNNRDAINFEKVLNMSTSEQKKTANQFAKHIKKFGAKVKSVALNENQERASVEVPSLAEAPHMNKDDVARCHELLKSGKVEDLDAFFTKFTKGDAADDQEGEDAIEKSDGDTKEMSKLFSQMDELKVALGKLEEGMVELSKSAKVSEEVMTLVKESME